MNKKERKANEILVKARIYVAMIGVKMNEASRQATPRVNRATPPKPIRATEEPVQVRPAMPRNNAIYDRTDIKKVAKGNFIVYATTGGQTTQIPRRFKSRTQAEEWCNIHT